MLPFFSFLFMWLGSLNWFFIAAFQYDFIAGFFGTQSSLFSRLIYFIIGMAGFVMFFMMIKNKGNIKIFEKPFRKNKKTVSEEKKNQEDEEYDNEYNIPQSPSYKVQPIIQNTVSKEGYKDFDVTKYDN